jgi:Mrp family chromosome partitioning ATPase/capsular polysaccharide biosynthesis protein
MPDTHDEPDLLRDQFRQLTRYRSMLVAGVVVGLLGAGWLAISRGNTYAATSEILVRSATADPFATGTTADKGINIGSERQTAMSSTVAELAARNLAKAGDRTSSDDLLAGIQVTNPPNTLVLRFTYTGDSAGTASRRTNAFTQAYLDNRRELTKSTIDNMIAGYRAQLTPLVKQRDELQQQLAGVTVSDKALSTIYANQASVASSISQLTSDINQLKSLDTTPGTVIRKASPPSSPSGPGQPLLLGLGAVVGLTVGLLAAWVRLVFDPAVRSTGDVVRALRAPVLGTLPRVRPGPLLATDHADSRLAEEYRSVAFRIAYDQRFAERRRLLVTGPRGTSETAAAVAVNLSASFAEMGKDVLLVEADLRTPRLSARLRSADGTRPNWARSARIGEGAGWPSNLQVPIDAGESGSFDLVPGSRVRNVARSLTSAAATRLIAEADEPGSVVIVLAPPVLSYADALAMVDRVDAVVVVCDPRDVHRVDLERVRELITGADGWVLGAVLHSAEAKPLLHRRRTTARPKTRAAGRRGAAPAAVGPPRADVGDVVPPEPEADSDPHDTLTLRIMTMPTSNR